MAGKKKHRRKSQSAGKARARHQGGWRARQSVAPARTGARPPAPGAAAAIAPIAPAIIATGGEPRADAGAAAVGLAAGLAQSPPIIRVWRNRNYALFEAGFTPQNITSWIQRVGVTWLAWELSHSNTWVGAVAAADLAPMIVLAPIAGAVTDRSPNPMRLLMITKLLLLAQAVALAALALAGLLTIELLFVLSLASGLIQPYASAARQIILAASVARTDFATGIALDSALFQATRFIGPAIAAVMINVWGISSTFLAHIGGSALLVASLACMRVERPDRRGRLRRGILIDVVESVHYVRAHGAIWPLFMLLTISSMLLRPVQDLLPGFASKVFAAGPEGLGWLASAMGVGAMISATAIAVRGRAEGLSTWAIVGGLLLVGSTLGFCATDDLRLGLLFAALCAFSLNTMSTSIQTITQSVVSDDMRGRVMSLYSLIFRGLPAIGAVGLGALADGIGLQASFALAAVMSLLVWLPVASARREIAAALAAEHERPVGS